MTLSSLAFTIATTISTTLNKQKNSRNSKFSTFALFFVATTASSAARAFSSSSAPTAFLPRRSGASTSSLLNTSLIYNTRGGGSLTSTVGRKFSLTRRFSSIQIEQEQVVSEMDQVKSAASKTSAADKLALMRKKMEENGVDGAFYSSVLSCCDKSYFDCFYQHN